MAEPVRSWAYDEYGLIRLTGPHKGTLVTTRRRLADAIEAAGAGLDDGSVEIRKRRVIMYDWVPLPGRTET